jgi:hypothetical protein
LINKYEHLIRKLEKQSTQKSDQQVEAVVGKAHKELKSMEGNRPARLNGSFIGELFF